MSSQLSRRLCASLRRAVVSFMEDLFTAALPLGGRPILQGWFARMSVIQCDPSTMWKCGCFATVLLGFAVPLVADQRMALPNLKS